MFNKSLGLKFWFQATVMVGGSLLLLPSVALGQDATWQANPGSAQFTTGSNWSTGSVPTGTATFGASSATSLTVSGGANLSGLSFLAGAPAFNFTINNVGGIFLTGTGISNASSSVPSFINNWNLHFVNSATAANATITNNNNGWTLFAGNSSAGSATIVNNVGGLTHFYDSSTADNATIINNAGGRVDISVMNTGITIGTLSGAGDVFLGSKTLTLGGASNTAISGPIQDGGSNPGTGGELVKQGAGTLTLSGTNTYTGGTTVTGGLINFANATNFGTGQITLNGGGLQWSSGTSTDISARLAALGAGGGTLDTNGNNVTLATGLGGVGGLAKSGSGTLTLSGASNYTGPTTVSGGTLLVNGSIASSSLTWVNSGATLSGTGTVGTTRIQSGGTLAPGAAGSTMTVAGNISFGAGSTYGVQATPSAASAITVTGVASVQPGATLQASFAPGTYYTRNYTVLSAAGGRSGNFSLATTGLPQGFTPSLNYTPTDVQLILTANLGSSTISSGQVLTGNQAGVANALNSAFNSGAYVPSGLQSVFTLSGSAQTGALNSLTGEAQTGGASAGFSFGGQFMNTVMGGAGSGGFSSGGTGGFAPSGSGRGGGFRGGTAPDGSKGGGGVSPDRGAQSTGARTVQSASLAAQADSCEAESCGDDPRRLHAWIEGFGGYGWLGGTSGSSSLQSTARGMAVGAGWAFDGGTLGVTFATGGTNWFLENGLGGGRSSNFQVGLYGTTELGPLYLMGVGAWGQQMVNSQRPVPFLGDWLTANYTASTWSGRLETGHRFALGAHALTPFLAGQGIVVSTPGFCEASMTGSGAALCFGGGTTSSIRSELGLEGETDLGAVWGSRARLVGRLSWAHEYQTAGPATAWFQALPGASFSVTGTPLPSDIAVGRVVSTFELDNTWALRLQADAEVADRYVSVAGTVRLSARW